MNLPDTAGSGASTVKPDFSTFAIVSAATAAGVAPAPFTFMLRYTPGSSVQAAINAMMATRDSRHIAP